MTWILRFLLFVVLFYLIRSVLSRLFGWTSDSRNRIHRGSRPSKGPIRTLQREVLRDPQCGTYVDREIAVASDSPGGTLYFCSEECRSKYIEGEISQNVER